MRNSVKDWQFYCIFQFLPTEGPLKIGLRCGGKAKIIQDVSLVAGDVNVYRVKCPYFDTLKMTPLITLQ